LNAAQSATGFITVLNLDAQRKGMVISMPDDFDIHEFFKTVTRQDGDKLRAFFAPDAMIFWANTNERFTVDEYVRANCEYPGEWDGRIENFYVIKSFDSETVFVAKVRNAAGYAARVVSFITFADTEDRLIQYLTEYWGDIGESPEWRKKMNIGTRYKDEDSL
jgi:hypothetical protein